MMKVMANLDFQVQSLADSLIAAIVTTTRWKRPRVLWIPIRIDYWMEPHSCQTQKNSPITSNSPILMTTRSRGLLQGIILPPILTKNKARIPTKRTLLDPMTLAQKPPMNLLTRQNQR
jgi:hypothetical protein